MLGIINTVRRWILGKEKEKAEAEKISKGVGDLIEAEQHFFAEYGLAGMFSYFNIGRNMMERYRDYEEMVAYPEIAAALSIYADNICQPNMFTGKTVWITSDHQVIKEKLEKFLYDTIDIETHIWQIVRDTCKYGNWFIELLYHPDKGIIGFNNLPVTTMRIVKNPKGRVIGYYQDLTARLAATEITYKEYEDMIQKGITKTDKAVLFKPEEIVHFRIRSSGDTLVRGYGESILESSRWLFRRLLILEDSVIIYRLTRSPQRFVIYTDVGNLSAHEARAELERIKTEFNKKKYIDPNTGQLTSRFSPLSSDENFYVAIHGEKDQTRIESLTVPVWDYIADVEHFYNKIFTALKIPKAYLTYESEERVRSILALKDINFSRTVMRIQMDIKLALKRLCDLYLASINIDPDTVQYAVEMTSPGQIYEIMQAEVYKNRLDLAREFGEWLPKEMILKEILKLSDEQIQQIMGKTEEDKSEKGEEEAAVEVDKTDELSNGAVDDYTVSNKVFGKIGEVMDSVKKLENISNNSKIDELLMEMKKIRKKLDLYLTGLYLTGKKK